jgi:hypothetical protein
MSRQSLLVACSALLLAGVAQAAPEAQAVPERLALDQQEQEVPAPTAGDDTKDAGGNMTAKESRQALPTDAPPVQTNGGDCGSN